MFRLLATMTIVGAMPIAAADDLGAERIQILIAVGETRVIEVGFARMHFCDDVSIVQAEMRDKTVETNVFVVKGLEPGTTDCRVGLDPADGRPSYLFGVTVEKAAPPAKPARPAKPKR